MRLHHQGRFLILVQWGSGLVHIRNYRGHDLRPDAITEANRLAKNHDKKHGSNAPTFYVVERIAFCMSTPRAKKVKEKKKSAVEILPDHYAYGITRSREKKDA